MAPLPRDGVATLVRVDGRAGVVRVPVRVERIDSVDAVIRVYGFPDGGYRPGDRFVVPADKVTLA